MKSNIFLLKQSKLFSNIPDSEIQKLLNCMHPIEKNYKKNECILHQEETIHSIGFVLAGNVLIEQEDFWGNRHILQEILPGNLFAESYACQKEIAFEHTVFARKASTILFLDLTHLWHPCSKSCSFHWKLMENLLSAIAEKNITLTRKTQLLSKKTIRDRLLSYLSYVSQTKGSSQFSIPYNRQELAAYLCVDRSALSYEISKIQKEGILTCWKNTFSLDVLP